jgi:hypothetical protein
MLKPSETAAMLKQPEAADKVLHHFEATGGLV